MADTSRPYPLEHDGNVNNATTTRTTKRAQGIQSFRSNAEAETVHVLVADSGAIQSQLLTRALRARREFRVSAVALEVSAMRDFIQSNRTDVVLIAGNHLPDLTLLRWLHISYPKIAPVFLAETDDREVVVNTFRAGAKGIFLFSHTPFAMLCKCIHSVFEGQTWINSKQLGFVLTSLSEVPTLRVVNSNGRFLLTPREEQVVALVADGMSNRGVAVELGLSEHTVKKYMMNIFDKVGISNRVELVLYAMSHGENRPGEWLPGNA
jgi:DNA-binding NarL/FixJ family response regulator